MAAAQPLPRSQPPTRPYLSDGIPPGGLLNLYRGHSLRHPTTCGGRPRSATAQPLPRSQPPTQSQLPHVPWRQLNCSTSTEVTASDTWAHQAAQQVHESAQPLPRSQPPTRVASSAICRPTVLPRATRGHSLRHSAAVAISGEISYCSTSTEVTTSDTHPECELCNGSGLCSTSTEVTASDT